MKRVTYAGATVNDISDIWDYTEDRWSYAEAAAYGSVKRRLAGKKARGEVKALRGSVDPDKS